VRFRAPLPAATISFTQQPVTNVIYHENICNEAEFTYRGYRPTWPPDGLTYPPISRDGQTRHFIDYGGWSAAKTVANFQLLGSRRITTTGSRPRNSCTLNLAEKKKSWQRRPDIEVWNTSRPPSAKVWPGLMVGISGLDPKQTACSCRRLHS
jgi:hypothetical protein